MFAFAYFAPVDDNMARMNITVVGIGYVGLSLAVMLSSKYYVTALDTNPDRIALLSKRISPLQDKGIEAWLGEKELDLHPTTSLDEAYASPDFIILAVPTNYDEKTHHFDTSILDSVLDELARRSIKATVVIKSTIPVGYTEEASKKRPGLNILFSPEFLRESKALEDNLHPSRIVVGSKDEDKEKAIAFANLLASCAEREDTPILLTGYEEAEAIKLFANTYLALRVAYFNELDTYAIYHKLDTKSILEGVCLDPRIGSFYNNPSFGYGGYCLPKDTKQLLNNFDAVPQNLIRAIVDSNATRKKAVSKEIIEEARKRNASPTVGIYRLTMKAHSDNFRQSAILDVIETLRKEGIALRIYEPTLKEDTFLDLPVDKDLEAFKKGCDLIAANRFTKDLLDIEDKVYTRDLFGRD